jgi:F-type H+-transporting ATPase subunit gamma
MDAFVNKEIDAVELIYSEFKNAATQRFVAEQFLPVLKLDKEVARRKLTLYLSQAKKC